MSKVVGIAVAVVVAAAGASLLTRSPGVAAPSEAVATSVPMLPLEIVKSWIIDPLVR